MTAQDSAAPRGIAAVAGDLATLAHERVAALGDHASDEAHRRSRQLVDHLEGHVLPRARSLNAPLLVLLIGPTGAGKSSLLNALAGFAASPAGVIRPTTREVVVVAAPGAGATLLATGSALEAVAAGRATVVESERAPEGIALVDSPDIDSIEHANRELTDRLVEAADLGIFVTTATRYADRVPWDVLGRIRERGLPLLVVVNRMPEDAADRALVVDDVARLLGDAGLTAETIELIAIGEGSIDPAIDGLSGAAVEPIRRRIDALGADREARRSLAERAVAGSLAGLAPLAERVADDLEHEAIEVEALRRFARHAFDAEAKALRQRLAGGTFLRAEALRQWQAFVGADEITRFFSSGIGKLRGTLSALFRGTPPAPVAEVREDALDDLAALARSHAGEAARRTATSWSEERSTRRLLAGDASLWSLGSGFDAALRAGLEDWVDGIAEEVRTTGGRKRILAKGASIGVNATGVGVMLATFVHTGGLTGTEVGVVAATGFLNQKLLEALFGEAALAEMMGHARENLASVLDAAFEREVARYERLVPDGAELRDLASRLRAAARDVAALRTAA